MKRTIKQHSQVQIMKLTKECQVCGTKPGCMRAYIDTVCWPRIADMDAAPRIQARVFQNPAKNPHTRPYFPAVMVAQW